MRIFVTGTRGIPNIPGGIEKHCQELFPRIAAAGHEVFLCTRSPYVRQKNTFFKGVRLIHLHSPKSKSLETIVHTMTSLFVALRYQADILHIQAIGPGLLTPLARILGFNTVLTHHGQDYKRQKWNTLAKFVLKTGEYVGGRFANEVIVISKTIQRIVLARCRRSTNLIFNGVPIPKKSNHTDYIEELGLTPGKYILAVARFVPEKGLHDLIEAFLKANCKEKLVIAGDADHETKYSRDLKSLTKDQDRIVLPGYVTGEHLNQLYSFASLFALPSYHEGLPIALLEALSYGLPPIVSDIPANREVGLDSKCYYSCGDIDTLRAKIIYFLDHPVPKNEKENYRKLVERQYDWNDIANKTISVYKKISR